MQTLLHKTGQAFIKFKDLLTLYRRHGCLLCSALILCIVTLCFYHLFTLQSIAMGGGGGGHQTVAKGNWKFR